MDGYRIMSQTPLFIRLCSDHLSLEVIPRRNVVVDLKTLESAVKASQKFSTLVVSRRLLIVKHSKGAEITIRRDGRMIVRNASGDTEVRTLATELLSLSGN